MQLDLASRLHRRRHAAGRSVQTVAVPCRPLSALMADIGGMHSAHFLSLDVEGAEERVLETVDPACFAVVLVEMDGTHPRREKRIHARLQAAGLEYMRRLALKGSNVYFRPKRVGWRLLTPSQAKDESKALQWRCGKPVFAEATYAHGGERLSGSQLVERWKEQSRQLQQRLKSLRGGGTGSTSASAVTPRQ
jgi:hypothetical protein